MIFKLAKTFFLLLIFSLAFMQPYLTYFSFVIPPTDLLFLFTFSLFAVSLLFKQTKFVHHKFFLLLIFYFLAFFISALFSGNLLLSMTKLSGQLYLLCLPVLTFNLIQTTDDLKKTFMVWIGATLTVTTVGVLTIFLFYINRENWILNYTLFHYGSLPIWNYPRLQSTFINANMLCNYLSVGLIFILLAKKFDWIKKPLFYTLICLVLTCSIFTFSPGLGGIALSLGIWFYLEIKEKNQYLGAFLLSLGFFLALVFLAALTVVPNMETASGFSINESSFELPVMLSGRTLAWIGSWKTFIENPLVGVGLGMPACTVRIQNFSGSFIFLTDAHNIFLNIAAQAGIPGLLAITSLTFFILKLSFPIFSNFEGKNVLRIGLGITFISAFVYQGIGGSFEDARHLWVLTGIILAAQKLTD